MAEAAIYVPVRYVGDCLSGYRVEPVLPWGPHLHSAATLQALIASLYGAHTAYRARRDYRRDLIRVRDGRARNIADGLIPCRPDGTPWPGYEPGETVEYAAWKRTVLDQESADVR